MEYTKARILYAEDDEALSYITTDNLHLNNFAVTHCKDGKECLEKFREGNFDLVILDVMMPEIDGFEVARMIRRSNESIPIIFLTAKTMKEDKISGLKLGGDDYILKPFSIEELLLKINVFLKRRNLASGYQADTYSVGSYSFDHKNLKLIHASETRDLTSREAELLKFLIERKNSISKRSEILETIWGEDDYFLGRSLDVFISRLRKYFSADPNISIENVHGVGFRLLIENKK
jgi:DNA-binding response OmpR family regulator